jgi:ABC-2 type transport system ATP-binding protein
MGEVLRVDRLTKHFGDTIALDHVSFSVTGPGLTVILGPNGSGKTTLLDILEGLEAPSSGTFTLFGAAPAPYPRSRVGVALQREPQLEHATVGELATLFAAIHSVPAGARRILEMAGLLEREHVPASKLSGGESARLSIALALVHSPALVFLDEPTAHLDPAAKRQTATLLRDVAKTSAVVMTTHDLREAETLCEYVVFLVAGKLCAAGTPAELMAQVPSPTARTLEAAFFHFCNRESNE